MALVSLLLGLGSGGSIVLTVVLLRSQLEFCRRNGKIAVWSVHERLLVQENANLLRILAQQELELLDARRKVVIGTENTRN